MEHCNRPTHQVPWDEQILDSESVGHVDKALATDNKTAKQTTEFAVAGPILCQVLPELK